MSKEIKQNEVANSIQQDILKRTYQPGDKLPPEQELKTMYNAGRGTVREALKALSRVGLVEIKRGAKGGVFVKEIDAQNAIDTVSLLIRHKRVSVKYISEFRELLEPASAAYAIERATDENIAEMKKLLEEGRKTLNNESEIYQQFLEWELDMHLTLARISRNPLFEWLSGAIYIDYSPYRSMMKKDPKASEASLNDWMEIVDAMEKREAMRGIGIVREHIARFKRRFKKEEFETTGYFYE